jgi:hypothetical protein
VTKANIKNGSMQKRSFVLKNKTSLIGRSSTNDIQIRDSFVSRKHARILKVNDRFFIEDMGSKNGTWINGNAIDSGKKIEIQEGIPIRMGNTLISLDKAPIGSLPNKYLLRISSQPADRSKSPALRDRRIRNKEKVELIYNMCLDLMQSLEVKEICENVVDSLFYYMNRIDSVHILLVEEGNEELTETAVRWRKAVGSPKPGCSRTIVNRVLIERKAIIIPDTSVMSTV